MAVLARAGYCARCEDQVLIQRERRAFGYSDYRCTRCGTITPPLPDGISIGRLIGWGIVLAVVALAIFLYYV